MKVFLKPVKIWNVRTKQIMCDEVILILNYDGVSFGVFIPPLHHTPLPPPLLPHNPPQLQLPLLPPLPQESRVLPSSCRVSHRTTWEASWMVSCSSHHTSPSMQPPGVQL